ncbi:MAG: hypothetical protein K2F94_08225 [Muribaculaceae bacterium]|nr:hypothetical protein [Muribaculaceae bacterium]MDE6533363.1 hypothetical protein [Muribaculaceae bacterium]
MDSKEKQFRDNEPVNADMIADSLKAEGRNRKRENTRKINRLWLWLGVLVLIAILLYWLFSIGIIGSLNDSFNG